MTIATAKQKTVDFRYLNIKGSGSSYDTLSPIITDKNITFSDVGTLKCVPLISKLNCVTYSESPV